jgi:hypothetical protein
MQASISARITQVLSSIWRKLKLIEWISAVLAIIKAAKKEDLKVEEKYVVIKPRILSDENYLRGVSALKVILTFLPFPGVQIAGPILALGEVGFKLWKRISLSREYEQLEYPPMDPNMLRFFFQLDPELAKHYGSLTSPQNWGTGAIQELEPIFNDLSFLTNFEMLRAKYPHLDHAYLKQRASENLAMLRENLDSIEQALIQVSQSPETDANIRGAFESLKGVFPAMNDWALFNSEGFDEVIDIIDTIL